MFTSSCNLLKASGVGKALFNSLVDYWEVNPTSTLLSSKRATTGSSTACTTLTGVDGVTNNAIGATGFDFTLRYVDFTNGSSLGVATTGNTLTIVCWVNSFVNAAVLIGDLGSAISTFNSRGGYRIDTNEIVRRENTTTTNFTLPAVTLPSGNNGYQFLVMSFTTNTFPSQTFKIYSGTGSELISSTQNFGLSFVSGLSVSRWLNNMNTFTVDKMHVFKRSLTASEIAFLYNSGAGRTYTEIQDRP